MVEARRWFRFVSFRFSLVGLLSPKKIDLLLLASYSVSPTLTLTNRKRRDERSAQKGLLHRNRARRVVKEREENLGRVGEGGPGTE